MQENLMDIDHEWIYIDTHDLELCGEFGAEMPLWHQNQINQKFDKPRTDFSDQ